MTLFLPGCKASLAHLASIDRNHHVAGLYHCENLFSFFKLQILRRGSSYDGDYLLATGEPHGYFCAHGTMLLTFPFRIFLALIFINLTFKIKHKCIVPTFVLFFAL